MPLAVRISSGPSARCPIGALRMAAERREREAATLFQKEEYHGCFYLAGYAAELDLGYCYARADGKESILSDARGLLGPAKSEAKTEFGINFVNNYFRQGHSPLFWWELFSWKRETSGRPIPYNKKKELGILVNHVQQTWDVWLRYVPSGATRQDAEELLYCVKEILSVTKKMQR